MLWRPRREKTAERQKSRRQKSSSTFEKSSTTMKLKEPSSCPHFESASRRRVSLVPDSSSLSFRIFCAPPQLAQYLSSCHDPAGFLPDPNVKLSTGRISLPPYRRLPLHANKASSALQLYHPYALVLSLKLNRSLDAPPPVLSKAVRRLLTLFQDSSWTSCLMLKNIDLHRQVKL